MLVIRSQRRSRIVLQVPITGTAIAKPDLRTAADKGIGHVDRRYRVIARLFTVFPVVFEPGLIDGRRIDDHRFRQPYLMLSICLFISTARKRNTADSLVVSRKFVIAVAGDQRVLVVDRKIEPRADLEPAGRKRKFFLKRNRVQRRVQNDRVKDRVIVLFAVADVDEIRRFSLLDRA